jgi:hypothetical protein
MTLRLPERSTHFSPLHRTALIRCAYDRRRPFGSDWGTKSRDETIATAFGDQDLGMGGVAFDFLAQAIDMGFQGVG